ncbi:transient receptor potential cation channel subfamily V member 5-like isoform X2 [Tubulanus polymorphus]|uniref:transient receptor potential cation channel subfamily V member 5-like isoform X2 n=1 Tax=Tubulanus polymorphus TaxID=672921 RepID=UPI003DA45820
MGNTNTSINTGVKKQIQNESRPLYSLVNLGGTGELVTLMQDALSTNDYSKLDDAILTKVKPYLYRGGKGKMILKSKLVEGRRDERTRIYEKLATHDPREEEDEEILEYFSRPRGLIVSSQAQKSYGQTMKLPLTPGSNLAMRRQESIFAKDSSMLKKFYRGDSQTQVRQKQQEDNDLYRFCCWDIDKRGTVGETIFHLCCLNGSTTHVNLAKRLVEHFPNLAMDIYIKDEYYGENPLHMAIVNENPALLKKLLECKAGLHDRACGNFFCADDQKAYRNDYIDSEAIQVPLQTNYRGFVYFGEYPLSFAASLGLQECVRLLVAHGAELDRQDMNGNTALHMSVIYNRKDMFDLLHDLGGSLTIRNRLGMTPLSLAAHMGKLEIYRHIIDTTRRIQWNYGSVTCATYPLKSIDTCDINGEIDSTSVLYKIVHGSDPNHLKMYDGMVIDLLEQKWNAYIKFSNDPHRTNVTFVQNGTNLTTTKVNECYLLQAVDSTDYARIVLECITLLFAVSAVFYVLILMCMQSTRLFFRTLIFAPSRTMFLIGCILVILSVPGRFTCSAAYEDVMITLAVLFTVPHFLFFCRGFKVFGPFVSMIYKIVSRDILRFMIIYLIFLIGFSQSLYICFRSVPPPNSFWHPLNALVSMFAISLHEFQDFYEEFEKSQHQLAAKAVFLFNMVFTAILLTNLLIAMMARTYISVQVLDREWLRQWSQVVLVMELTVSRKSRLKEQQIYSIPASENPKDGRLFFVRWRKTVDEQKRENM